MQQEAVSWGHYLKRTQQRGFYMRNDTEDTVERELNIKDTI